MNTTQSVLIYIAGLIIVLMAARALSKPLRVIIKLAFNTLLGGIALILINTAGSMWGFYLGVNPLTAAVAGILGIPGVILLVVLKLIFG